MNLVYLSGYISQFSECGGGLNIIFLLFFRLDNLPPYVVQCIFCDLYISLFIAIYYIYTLEYKRLGFYYEGDMWGDMFNIRAISRVTSWGNLGVTIHTILYLYKGSIYWRCGCLGLACLYRLFLSLILAFIIHIFR